MTKTESTNYQKLSTELDEVLIALQNPDAQVDTALELYKQGLDLVERLEKHLKTVENTITKLNPVISDK